MTETRTFEAWLDRNCDLKKRHVGPSIPEHNNGVPFECNYWWFVLQDFEDGRPSVALKVDANLLVELENYAENGEIEAICFLAQYKKLGDFEELVKNLSRVSR
jgi:hypothetical protein